MDRCNIALVSQTSIIGEKQNNLDKTVEWVEKAHRNGVKLVCFPELGLTGHAGLPDMVGESESVPDGMCVRTLCNVSKELNLYICAGIAENDRGIHYNTQFLTGPEGFIGKQRKIHPSKDEYFYFRGGTKLNVFDLPFARIGMIICYDNSFPEIARCHAVNGAEILICPLARRGGKWSDDVKERLAVIDAMKNKWMKMFPARSLDNGCYSLVYNMTGDCAVNIEGAAAPHVGGGMVFDPAGNAAAELFASDFAENMLIAELDGRKVHDARTGKCFNLSIRKPEVFGDLSRRDHE